MASAAMANYGMAGRVPGHSGEGGGGGVSLLAVTLQSSGSPQKALWPLHQRRVVGSLLGEMYGIEACAMGTAEGDSTFPCRVDFSKGDGVVR